MTNLTYNETYEVVSYYANDVLRYFADGWDRFPVYDRAQKVLSRLESAMEFWSRRGNVEITEKLANAITTINHYANKY